MLFGLGPLAGAVILSMFRIAASGGHVANWFIQLEAFSMLVIYSIFIYRVEAGGPQISLLVLFTVLASEGAVGLAVIVRNRRSCKVELIKRRF